MNTRVNLIFISVFFCFITNLVAQPTDPGLYAKFNTSLGSFTCKLEFEKVPMTVANFVGLAEGSIDWVDLKTSELKKNQPYYDGIIFHRVIADFIIQAGSKNGEGTDGPGYRFLDEIDSTLRHTKSGLLSMANSGVNTNGSQFFITLRETAHLDDKHSVFGEVVENMAVVENIGVAETGSDTKPDVEIIINSIDIIRVGQDALDFDVTQHSLPSVEFIIPQVLNINENLHIRYIQNIFSEYTLFYIDDLGFNSVRAGCDGWCRTTIAFFNNEPSAQDLNINSLLTVGNSSVDKQFYRLLRTDLSNFYKSSKFVGKIIRFESTNINDQIQLSIATIVDKASGTFNLGTNIGTLSITDHTWHQLGSEPGNLTIKSQGIVSFRYFLTFNDPNSGTYIGVAFTSPQALRFQGNFTITDI